MDGVAQIKLNRGPRLWRVIATLTALGLLAVITLSVANAQSSTLYSYDDANHLVQATTTTGTGVQYQYDLAGHLLQVSPITPTALDLNGAQTLDIGAAGQNAVLSFSAAAGQSVTLNFGSITTTPANSAVTVSVYNAGGALVASTTGSGSATLTLSDLGAGTYTVIVVPQNAATGSLQLESTVLSAQTGPSGDGPLPLWTYLLLGGVLLSIAQRASRRPASHP